MSGDGIEIRASRVDEIACGQCGHVMDVSRLPVFSSLNCPKCGGKLTVPALLGNLLLLEELGTGGMGAVYRGLDQALGRFVAVKVMKRSLGDDAKLVESFLREARTAAALNHPNIVQIYSCGQENGQPYIAMELVSGGRLDQMMADGKPVKESRLLEIALDVSEGLKAANGVGLVHGDIKPANILTDKNGTAKVVDFGLAQFVNRQQNQGEIWGTPFYISPERARGGLADHRSDIYSLGATLFHALTGKPPFDGKTAADVVLARLKEPAPDVREFNPLLQPETAAVIGRMLEADTARRYPTSASLQADLRAALAAARDAEKHGGRRSVPKKPSSGSNTGLYVFLGVVAVIGVAALIYFTRKEGHSPPPPVAVAQMAPTEKLGETFFAGDNERWIRSAAEDIAAGQVPKALAKFDKLAAEVPPNSARAVWVRVLKVVPLWVEGRDREARESLTRVAAVKINRPDEDHLHMPQVLARYLLDEIDEAELERRLKVWPTWFRHLVVLYRGIEEFSWGDFLKGTRNLQTFAEAPNRQPEWVYAFQPSARKWLEMATRWEEVRKLANKDVADGKAAAGRERVEKFMFEVPPFLRPAIDQELQRLRMAAGEKVPTVVAAQTPASLTEVQIDSWAPQDFSGRQYITRDFDISRHVKKEGPYTLRFQHHTGSAAIEIEWVALVVNDKELARDAHFGTAGKNKSQNASYVLQLPVLAPGGKYIARVSWRTDGGKTTRGGVFLDVPPP